MPAGRIIPFHRIRYHWGLYLFVIPTVMLIGLFQYYPAASGIFHSFYRWNGGDICEYVGFTNFYELMKNDQFWRSFQVALTLGLWGVIKMIPPLVAAVCIHRCTSARFQYLYRILFIMPMVVPGLVMALIWRSLFFEPSNGYLNYFISSIGLFDKLAWLDKNLHWGGIFLSGGTPAWLGDPRLILFSCVIWGFPWVASFAVLNHLARLQSIGNEIYEAAALDGVTWWTKFWHIELPLLTGSLRLLLVLVILDSIKDATAIFALAGIEGGPGGIVTVPALFMMRKAFIEQNLGSACAVGLVLMIVVMSLQKIIEKWPLLDTLSPRVSWLIKGLIIGFFWFLNCLMQLGLFWGLILGCITLWWLCGDWLTSWWSTFDMGSFIRKDIPRSPRYEMKVASPLEEGLLRSLKHVFLWCLILFALFPIFLMIIVSFKNNQQFYMAPGHLTVPMHWENWGKAWNLVGTSLANSLFVSISVTAGSLLLALCGAYFFARYRMPFSGWLWNLLLILLMMPLIANLIPLFQLLSSMHLTNTLIGLIIVGLSSGQVFAIFVLRDFIEEIPVDLFEAADMDGASHWQQLRNVVIPLVGPILGTIGVITFVGQWNDFIMPMVLIRDPDRLTIMVKLQYLTGDYLIQWGPLMAGYVLASIPMILLFSFSMKLFIKGVAEGAVKG